MRVTRLKVSVMSLSGLINLFMPMSIAINQECDYYQDLVLGQLYYIYNPEYPRSYSGETACRWVARSALSTRIVISCEDIEIPTTVNCQGDRLAISLSGDTQFKDARIFCGKGTKSFVSNQSSLAVGLFSSGGTSGGRFLCSLTAITAGEYVSPPSSPISCDCGWRQEPRIVNGTEAGVNEFPLMAGLIDLQRRSLECGATIISVRYAITAAHCILTEARYYALLAGDHDISTGNDTQYAALYLLELIKRHPEFNASSLENDIALLKTSNNIAFSFAVGPACLPFRYSYREFIEARVLALGWGQLFFAGPKSDTLQKVNLTVLSNAQCQYALPNQQVFNTQLCTYAPYKDSCQGDSGGPILWFEYSSRRLFLIGVISQGTACATELPAKNTRVTSYLAWIITETSDAEYCIK